MSGETQQSQSGWTVDTLHAHYQQRLLDMDLRYEQRFAAQQTALDAALASLNKRLDGLNELRSGVATTAEVNAANVLISDIKGRLDRMEGTTVGGSDQQRRFMGLIGVGIAASAVLVSVVVVVVNVLLAK